MRPLEWAFLFGSVFQKRRKDFIGQLLSASVPKQKRPLNRFKRDLAARWQ